MKEAERKEEPNTCWIERKNNDRTKRRKEKHKREERIYSYLKNM
jgi:hypothetical protein